ncbi:MAG TPA: tRNA-dihydrouridine synthase, partial [Steroidobacteraceae bacterium]
RTRTEMYQGNAEHQTAAAIKANVKIPVFANGDIVSAQHARQILQATGCDGVMIGRGAQGRPWIFDEVNYFLATGENRPVLALENVRDIMRAHLEDVYAFYGDQTGVRVARKHLSWYFRQNPGQEDLRNRLVQIETPEEQLSTLLQYYDTGMDRAA